MSNSRKSIFTQIIDAREVLKVNQDEEVRLKLLSKLESYIQSGVWYNGKDRETFLKYMFLRPKDFAVATGKTQENSRWLLKRSSDRLFSLLGESFVYDLMYADIDTLRNNSLKLGVLSSTSVARDFFLSDIFTEIDSVKPVASEYDVSDVLKELVFLRKYSFAQFKRDLSLINLDKLSYIVQVLNSNEPILVDDKVKLIREFSHGELIAKNNIRLTNTSSKK